MTRPAPAYNQPPASYRPPTYEYVVTMRRGTETETSRPLSGSAVDAYIGRQHRGFGWQYVGTEQREVQA